MADIGPSNHRAKNQNFRNSTYYIPLDPEFYADHYSHKKRLYLEK